MLPWWTCDSKVLKEPFKDQSFGGGDNAGIKAGRTPASKGCLLQALKPQKALHLGIQWPEVEQQLNNQRTGKPKRKPKGHFDMEFQHKMTENSSMWPIIRRQLFHRVIKIGHGPIGALRLKVKKGRLGMMRRERYHQ